MDAVSHCQRLTGELSGILEEDAPKPRTPKKEHLADETLELVQRRWWCSTAPVPSVGGQRR